MANDHVFISHATADDAFVHDLRHNIQSHGLPVWDDSTVLRGGDTLAHEIETAIEQARHVVVVLSPNTVNSPWVRREIRKALDVRNSRKDGGYRVIPLLLPGIDVGALPLWFDQEPVAVHVCLGPGGLQNAMPDVLAALGMRSPTKHPLVHQPDEKPVDDLILELKKPVTRIENGKVRAMAEATLIYKPADPAKRPVGSKRYEFTSPIGPIETEDLRWYLEEYFRWPVGVFKKRADEIEAKLPQWGEDLYAAALAARGKSWAPGKNYIDI